MRLAIVGSKKVVAVPPYPTAVYVPTHPIFSGRDFGFTPEVLRCDPIHISSDKYAVYCVLHITSTWNHCGTVCKSLETFNQQLVG